MKNPDPPISEADGNRILVKNLGVNRGASYPRLLLFISLLLCGCDHKSHTELDPALATEFSKDIHAHEPLHCDIFASNKSSETFFDGYFIPSDEDHGNMLSTSVGLYEIVLTNELFDEMTLSKDGKGGPRFADAFAHAKRKKIRGIAASGTNCSISRRYHNFRGFLLVRSYGIAL